MNLRGPLLASLLMTALALSAVPASAETTAVVTLRVAPEGFVVPSHWAVGNQAVWVIDPATQTETNDLPGVAGCTLTVPDADLDGDVDGGEVLDAAAGAGCISGWSSTTFPCCGRFVTEIDGVAWLGDGLVTWWFMQINGFGASSGIDGLALSDGDSLEFVYYVGPL